MKTTIDKSELEKLLKERGDVIDKHNFIEGHLSGIIQNHFNPEDRENFNNILMNSSIIGFGNKIKVLRGLDYLTGKQATKLYDLSSFRNAFAHQDLHGEVEIEMDEKVLNWKLLILRNSGNIETHDPHEYYKVYCTEYEECLRFLRVVLANSSLKGLS